MTRNEWIVLGLAAGVVAIVVASREEPAKAALPEKQTQPPALTTEPDEAKALLAKAEANPAAMSDFELARMKQLAAILATNPEHATLAGRLALAAARVEAAKAAPPGPNPPGGVVIPGGGGVLPGGVVIPPGGVVIPGGGGVITPPAAEETSKKREPIPPIIRRWQAALVTVRTNPRAVNRESTAALLAQLQDAGFLQEATMLRTEADAVLRRRPAMTRTL